jgi:uncharacterized protein (TIGR02001 family)
MKKLIVASLLTATVAAPFAVRAEDAKPDAGPWSLGGSLDVTSDYRFRGISQTYKLPAWQGEFDLKHSSGFYASTAGQNVSGNEYVGGDALEWDWWGGYSFEVAKDVPLDFGLYYYLYPGSKVPGSLKQYNTGELYVDITFAGLMAKLSYGITDFFGAPSSKGSWYADLTYNYDISKETHLFAHVGHQQVKGTYSVSPNYTDYKLGGSIDAAGLNWAAAVVGTNAKAAAYTVTSASDGSTKVVSKSTLVLTVTKSF